MRDVDAAAGGDGSAAAAGTPLRVAVVGGSGFIGGVHARSARLAGAQVQVVGASSLERARDAARELGAEHAISSPAELAACEVDVVHVCTPNRLHADYVRAALDAGMHVVCEKPLATDATTAAELHALAAERGLVATVPYVYRYYPTVRHARDAVAAGEFGSLHLLHGSYLQDWMSHPDDWSWRVDAAANGPSRAFADIGSHWCDLVEFVSGHRIVRVLAMLHTAHPRRRVADHTAAFARRDLHGDEHRHDVTTEDAAMVMFTTDRGAIGTVTVSQVSPGRKNRLWFELDGDSAAVVFDQEHPETLWVGGREHDTVLSRGSSPLSAGAERLSTLPGGHPQGYHDCFEAFVADTYRAVAGQAPDGLPTFDDGLRSVRIVEAVLESARTDRWTKVET